MIKKTLTYHDFDGEEHTKDFYFSMNQTEFGLMNNKIPGGLENYLKRVQEDKDSAKLLDLLTMFITESYGERSDDGALFFKKDPKGRKLGEAFLMTEACDNLLTELLENENRIAAFLTGMLPTNIRGKVEEGVREARLSLAESVEPENTVDNATK